MDNHLREELQSIIDSWDGEDVVAQYDEPTGTWIFIALHSSVRGMPSGGTRMRHYAEPSLGLRDAMYLAEGMTAKWAVLGANKGGGKAVLAIPGDLQGQDREGLLRRYGALVDSLDGRFGTGEDLGTTPEDMAIVREETRWVHGLDPDGRMTDPGPLTAAGVAHGIDAAIEHVYGEDRPDPLTVLVQGVGDVGGPLCDELHRRGFRLLISDPDVDRCQAVARRVGADIVNPDDALVTECDVLAPCAIGGILNDESVPRLRCRIIAGSANNQLSSPEIADVLAKRNILYVPDYVINSGGALAFELHAGGLTDKAALLERMGTVGELVAGILHDARSENRSPVEAARRRVDNALT